MKFHILVLLVASIMPAIAMQACSQEAPQMLDDADANLTKQQWQQRLQDARARSEEFVAKARMGTSEPIQSGEEDAKAADQRAMSDPTLRPGDIISTSNGWLVFVGRDESKRRPSDFLPAPGSPTGH